MVTPPQVNPSCMSSERSIEAPGLDCRRDDQGIGEADPIALRDRQ